MIQITVLWHLIRYGESIEHIYVFTHNYHTHLVSNFMWSHASSPIAYFTINYYCLDLWLHDGLNDGMALLCEMYQNISTDFDFSQFDKSCLRKTLGGPLLLTLFIRKRMFLWSRSLGNHWYIQQVIEDKTWWKIDLRFIRVILKGVHILRNKDDITVIVFRQKRMILKNSSSLSIWVKMMMVKILMSSQCHMILKISCIRGMFDAFDDICWDVKQIRTVYCN